MMSGAFQLKLNIFKLDGVETQVRLFVELSVHYERSDDFGQYQPLFTGRPEAV